MQHNPSCPELPEKPADRQILRIGSGAMHLDATAKSILLWPPTENGSGAQRALRELLPQQRNNVHDFPGRRGAPVSTHQPSPSISSNRTSASWIAMAGRAGFNQQTLRRPRGRGPFHCNPLSMPSPLCAGKSREPSESPGTCEKFILNA